MLAYALQVFAAMAALLICYRIAFAGRPYHRASRLMLYAAVVLPLLLPLVPRDRSKDRPAMLRPVQLVLPEIVVTPGGVSGVGSSGESWSASQIGWDLYGLVALGLLAAYGAGYHRWTRRLLVTGGKQLENGVTLKAGTGYGPGSFGRVVFFPANDCNPAILRHEVAHIRLRHFEELRAWRVVCCLLWPHLLLWLALRWLRALHEYEADHYAANHHDREQYATLLLQSTLGARFPIPQTFSLQPLKNRIVMLYKEQTSKGRRQAWVTLTTLVALTVGAMMMVECKSAGNNQPATYAGRRVDTIYVEKGNGSIDTVYTMNGAGLSVIAERADLDSEIAPAYRQANAMLNERNRVLAANVPGYIPMSAEQRELPDSLEGNGIYKYVEHMPEFKGDFNQWISKTIQYPETAIKAKQGGRAVMQFIVDETGRVKDIELKKSSGVPVLDDEAARVLGTMPAWKPGRTKQGKVVPVYIVVPVMFQPD